MARQRRSRTIALSEPVEACGREVTELVMREPLVRDMLDAQVAAEMAVADQRRTATSAEVEVRLFAMLCGVPVEDLMGWPQSVYGALQDGYRFLSAPGQPLPPVPTDGTAEG